TPSPAPVFGCGGISKWRDAVEYLAAGASAVQVCTAVMLDGLQIIRRLTRGLDEYLQSRGLNSVTAIIGKGLPDGTREGLLRLYGQTRRSDVGYETSKMRRSERVGC